MHMTTSSGACLTHDGASMPIAVGRLEPAKYLEMAYVESADFRYFHAICRKRRSILGYVPLRKMLAVAASTVIGCRRRITSRVEAGVRS
jgi:hypothetical protein